MRGLVADADFIGQLARLVAIVRSPEWLPYWLELELTVTDFGALCIAPDTSDREVWERCRAEGLILVTANRNHDGPDSLEAAIRDAPPTALPVLTVSDGRRVIDDGAYARSVAIDMLDYLAVLRARPDALHGAGRLFLPKKPQ